MNTSLIAPRLAAIAKRELDDRTIEPGDAHDLLDALETAQRLCDKPFGQLDLRTFYELREALLVLGMWPVSV